MRAILDIGGKLYRLREELTFRVSAPDLNSIEIRVYDHDAGTLLWQAVNECERCGRFDTEEIVVHSFEEAVELGWLQEVGDDG